MLNNIKAVTIGDINGIGIKLFLKIWKNKRKRIGNTILISNTNIFKKYINKNNISLPIKTINKTSEINKCIYSKYFYIFNIKAKNEIENTYNSLKESYWLTKNNFCQSLITLPLNKEKIINRIDKRFIGQTEFLQNLDKQKNSNMIFYSKTIIITTLTTHISLNKVSSLIKNKNYFYNKIIALNHTLIKDFNIRNPKLVICGINPHAGENGLIGKEEVKYLKPIINKLNDNDININGPFSADSIFSKKNIKKYDCFVSIYHDQALIPFKLLSGLKGVNYTGSLKIIRTSPQHGTAYDLIYSNNASDLSLLNSFKLADKIYKNRLRNNIELS